MTGTPRAGHTGLYGVVVDEVSQDTVFGKNLEVTADAVTPGSIAYAIRAMNGGNITVEGDTGLVISTTRSSGNDAQAVGVLANNGSTFLRERAVFTGTRLSGRKRRFFRYLSGFSHMKAVFCGKPDFV